MENKSNVIIILLVVLIGAVAGGDLLTGIDNAVRASLSPMYAKIAEIDRTEKSIENKLNAGGNGYSNASLTAIQNTLSQIQNKINTNGANAQQPQQPPTSQSAEPSSQASSPAPFAVKTPAEKPMQG